MSCMILLPYFHLHVDVIEGNAEFKLGGKGLEKLKNFENRKMQNYCHIFIYMLIFIYIFIYAFHFMFNFSIN